MKIKRILLVVLVTAFVMNLFLASAVSEATASLTIDIDNGTTVQPGEEFSVSVNLSDLSEEVYMFQFAVTYDSSKLILQSTSAGDFFATAGSPTINSPEAGIVYINWDSINKSITEDCKLMLLTFLTVGSEPYETAIGFSESEEVVFANWDNAIAVSLIPLTVKIGVDELPTFKTHSLVLSGQIGVNFFMDLPAIEGVDYTESYMTFEISGKGTVSSDPVPYNPVRMNSKGTRYGFSCYVNSIQMADTITATFHYGEDQTVSETYSIKQYIASFDAYIAEHPGVIDDAMVNLVHTLADYGHYVQLFLAGTKGWTLGTGDDQYAEMDTYYTDSYDYNSIAEALSDYEIMAGNTDPNIKSLSYTLVLDSETMLRMTLKPVTGFTGDLYVREDDNAVVTIPLQSKRWMVEISNIPAHLLGQKYMLDMYTDAALYEGEENNRAWVVVSPMTYALMLLQNGDDAAKDAGAALYAYWQAAKTFK